MTDIWQRQPASDEAPHDQRNAAVLAPPRQRAMPQPADAEPKKRQRRLVHGHSVAADVSSQHRLLITPQFFISYLGVGFTHSRIVRHYQPDSRIKHLAEDVYFSCKPLAMDPPPRR